MGSATAGFLKGLVGDGSCREPSDLIRIQRPERREGTPGSQDQDGAAAGRLRKEPQVGAITRPSEQRVWQVRTPRFAAQK